jgi:hypothetical protein
MPVCVICNTEEASWQCIVCNRAIGPKCARMVGDKVYCLDHVPAQAEAPKPEQKRNLSGLRKAIWTVLILLIATGAMLFVTNSYISTLPEMPLLKPVMDILVLFQSMGLMVVLGIAGILALLIIAYVVLRRKK